MSYFSDNYDHIRYPLMPHTERGLRNAQRGAIWAVGSHFSQNAGAALLSLPTGAGKTGVLMMTPYILFAKRTLVVTPSRLVRNQIAEDFRGLLTLRKADIVVKGTPSPRVNEVEDKITDPEAWEKLREWDVVVATPSAISPHLEGVPAPPADLFDLLLVDEAHHSPAATWNGLLDAFPSAKRTLFTATPHRRDKKEIKAPLVYVYSLREAQEDGIFGEIEFVPVSIPTGAALGTEKEREAARDIAIARMTEEVFRADRAAGLEHCLMIRTDFKTRAKELQKIYEDNTGLHLKTIHSGLSLSIVKKMIQELRSGQLDGIICVDMLGEGFDFPNLKIAAIHAPHKSLEATLQFIGRFARTNAANLGKAKFIADPDSEVGDEIRALYQDNPTWKTLIANLSEARIGQEQEVRAGIEEFEPPSVQCASTRELSLYSLKPYRHVKIYRVPPDVTLDLSGEIAAPEGSEIIYRQTLRDGHATVFITHELSFPKWSGIRNFEQPRYELFVLYFDKASGLFFINSTRRYTALYEDLATQLTAGQHRMLTVARLNRVLLGMETASFTSIGMKSRVQNNSVESYRNIAGSNGQIAISQTDGLTYHRGHLHAHLRTADGRSNVGYSSASKVWSHGYSQIPTLLAWCRGLALKTARNERVVTNTSLDALAVGEEVDRIPGAVLCAEWDSTIYSKPTSLKYDSAAGETRHINFLDLELKINRARCTADAAFLQVELEDSIIEIGFSPSAFPHFWVENNFDFEVQRGQETMTLPSYLNNYWINFYLEDFSRLSGSEWLENPSENLSPFDCGRIEAIDWEAHNVLLTREFTSPQTPVDGYDSIHDFLKLRLQSEAPSVAIYDHRSGEIADFITFEETSDEVWVRLYHCKGSGGEQAGDRVDDVYEVCGQVIKSILWLNSRDKLADKINERIRGGSQFICGSKPALKNHFAAMKLKKPRFEVVLVQPGISQSKATAKILHVLAAADDYVRRVKGSGIRIFGSE